MVENVSAFVRKILMQGLILKNLFYFQDVFGDEWQIEKKSSAERFARHKKSGLRVNFGNDHGEGFALKTVSSSIERVYNPHGGGVVPGNIATGSGY